MAMPIGVLIALFLTEYAGGRGAAADEADRSTCSTACRRSSSASSSSRLLVDHKQQSGFAGAVALAIIELPLIARGSQEVLLLVPNSLREASDALGVAPLALGPDGGAAHRARRHRHRRPCSPSPAPPARPRR